MPNVGLFFAGGKDRNEMIFLSQSLKIIFYIVRTMPPAGNPTHFWGLVLNLIPAMNYRAFISVMPTAFFSKKGRFHS
jgi:hypothetical protein